MAVEKRTLTKSALQFRQEFGAVLDQMERGGAPIIIERNSEAIAVLVSYETFQKRFIEHQTTAARAQLLERFKSARRPSAVATLDLIRELRYGRER